MIDHMDCSTFEASLAEFLDGGLDRHTHAASERHRAGCAACHALVADLDAIVHAARALPLPTPSHDLWSGIEDRLETPVIDLGTARHRAAAVVPPTMVWRRLAVAAVALVTVSAGVTWTIARRDTPDTVVAERRTVPEAVVAADDEGNRATEIRPSAPGTVNAVLAASPRARTFAIDSVYGSEIAMLRTVADERLGLLDSSTVAVVRRNLDIIDRAIRESREALASDPNSGFLLEQLDRAYERKVDLLRRLTLL